MDDQLQYLTRQSKNVARLEIKNQLMDTLIELKKNEQYEYDKLSRCVDEFKKYHQGRADAFRIAQLKMELIINQITTKMGDHNTEIKNGN